MRRAILAVALALAGCGGPNAVPRKSVAWHMDATGAPVCVDADHEENWTLASGEHQHVCWWMCVASVDGVEDREVIAVFTSADGVTYAHAPGDGVGQGCR